MELELTLLVWSVLLLLVHIGLQSILLTRDTGREYNAGPRDEERPLGPLAGRAERALRNFLETWPAFIALALVVAITGRSDALTQWGAGLYLAFRVVYIPLYLLGIPYIRSMAWGVSLLGLLLMILGIFF